MEVYDNEKEQVDTLRRFFSDNSKILAAGVILGVAALAGWKYWNYHQRSSAQDISAQYQQLSSKLDASKPETFSAFDKFSSENNHVYGALAAMELAKQYAERGDLDKATAQLRRGLQATSDENLQAIINLRLARIQLQQQQADAAIETLSHIKDEGWRVFVANLRGDALQSKGDKEAAREAWSQGISADASSALRSILQMKINNLG